MALLPPRTRYSLANIIPGNHESATMNHMYGFHGEVKAKYTAQMAELFTEVYNWLPLAHCINRRVLVSASFQLLKLIYRFFLRTHRKKE